MPALVDLTGNGRHGRTVGAPIRTEGIPSVSDCAFAASIARRNYVRLDRAISAIAGPTITLAGWFRPRSTSSSDAPGPAVVAVNTNQSSTGGGLYNRHVLRWARGGQPRFDLNDGAAQSDTYPLDVWRFVAYQADGVDAWLRVDTAEVARHAWDEITSPNDWLSLANEYDGPTATNPSDPIDGDFDEWAVWPGVVAPSALDQLWSIGAGVTPGDYRAAVLSLAPAAYWSLCPTGGWCVGRIGR